MGPDQILDLIAKLPKHTARFKHYGADSFEIDFYAQPDQDQNRSTPFKPEASSRHPETGPISDADLALDPPEILPDPDPEESPEPNSDLTRSD